MNKPIKHILPQSKGNYIKTIFITLSFFILLSFSLVSCIQPQETIRMFDMNSITDINYTILSYPSDLQIDESLITLSIEDANDTESFMLLKNLIHSYETKVFESAKNKQSFTSNFELENEDFNISFASDFNKNQKKSYELHISMIDMKGYLKGPEGTDELDEEMISKVLNSSLINPDIDYATLPEVTLAFDNKQIGLSSEGSWHYFLFASRFQNELISTTSKDNLIKLSATSTKANIAFTSTIPNQLILNIYKDNRKGKLISSETLFPIEKNLNLTLPEINGKYLVEILCKWKAMPGSSYGDITYTFSTDIEAQEIFTLSKESYQPGDLLVLKGNYIDMDLNYTIESDLYNEGLSLQKNGNDYYIFLPIMSKAELGSYYISITDNDYPDIVNTIKFDVVYKEFDVQYLETTETTASLQNDDNYDQLNEAFARGRANLSLDKLWDGKFIQPVGGRISTEYGQIRYTNGKENSSRHSGIDFANPTGTIIVATQNGYVTLAEELNITGNTLFIDHGFGIISQYYHTSKILVSVGDYVTAGQNVAEVGTTGFSTGPHLHFSIFDNGIYLNPWKFFEAAPF